MREVTIGSTDDFQDPGRKLLEIDGVEIGIFKLDGEFFAYLNICPHLGGPACQGKIIAKVEELVGADGTSQGQDFSKTNINVTCPWHGYEFDIRTGRHQGYSRVGLAPVKIRVSGKDLVVTVPAPSR